MRCSFRAAVACFFVVAVFTAPGRATAQQPDPWEQARMRLGPVAFTPTIVVRNIGWDTNVFNTPVNPKGDFTVTAGGVTDWWLRAGRSRLHGSDEVVYAYFAKFDTERGVNQRHSLTFEFPLNRLKPYVQGSWLSSNDRPGYEIDARARHSEGAYRAGLVGRLSARTSLDVYASTTRYRFAGSAAFEGTYLAEVLNRKANGLGGSLRYSLTPLTTLSLSSDVQQERFPDSPVRDNNSFRIQPGVTFSPDALLKGSASFGFRKLNMLSATIPDFSGFVAAVDLGYVLRGATRFAVGYSRDVQFSYYVAHPYYLLNGVSGSVTQSVRGDWYVEARAAAQRLAYRNANVLESTPAPVDSVRILGGGIGYRLKQGSRISFNVDYVQRPHGAGAHYSGLRYGVGVNYGL
jgi:hypothetical protein